MELHTIRTRLTAGLLCKAERGDLGLALPVGLDRSVGGVVVKTPDSEVQARLALIFSTFLRVRSAAKVLRSLVETKLTLPRRGRFGDVVWRVPTIAAVLSVLKNPAYAGAFVYGRTRSVRHPAGGSRPQRLARDQWRIVVKDKYPAYVSWDTFEKIQALLSDNYAEYDRNKTRGIPRDGQALLHGLVYCGECGHKMVVQYKNGTRYICNFLRQQHGSPVCQYIPAVPVDAKAVAAFFEALAPAELEALAQATARRREAEVATRHAQAQQLERLRYRASLAERQYDQVDPDNRLVASELERRWEAALIEVRQAETALAERQQEDGTLSQAFDGKLRAAFIEATQRLPDIWQSTAMTSSRKKALLRCLLDKVVLHRVAPDLIHMRLVWRGGDVTVFDIPVAVGSLAALARSSELEARVLALARAGEGDEAITAALAADGHRSPMADRLLPSTVKAIRLRHGVMAKRSQSHPRRIDGCLTVPQLASRLGVEPHWIYDRIHKGTIAVRRDADTGLYLFPDRPEILGELEKLKAGAADRVAFDTNAGS